MKIYYLARRMPHKRFKFLNYVATFAIFYYSVEWLGEQKRRVFMKRFRTRTIIEAKENSSAFMEALPFVFDPEDRKKPLDFTGLYEGTQLFILSCDFKEFAPVLAALQETLIHEKYKLLFLTNKEAMLDNKSALGFLKEGNVDVGYVSKNGLEYFHDKFIVLNEKMEYINETDLQFIKKEGADKVKSAAKGGILKARDEKFLDFFRDSK